jgi:Uncharacterised protein conserved in bacteria (DUF2313)
VAEIRNLVTNPSLEVNTSQWVAQQATLARLTTDGAVGTACLEVTPTSAGQIYAGYYNLPIGGQTAGRVYTASVYVKGVGTTIGGTAQLWLSEAYGAVGQAQTIGANFTLQAGWQRVSLQRTLQQNDRTALFVYVWRSVAGQVQAGEHFLLDGMQIELSPTMSTYCDGDQPGAYWAGQPHASQSYAPLPEPPGQPYDLSSPSGSAARILAYLPALFQNFLMLRRIHGTHGNEVDLLRQELVLALEEAFVSTASTYGLDDMELTLGLPPNPSLTVEARRGRVLGHLLSWRQPTPQHTRDLANSFNNGQVTVDEMFDEYRVIVRLDSPTGIPENEADLEAAMLRYLPANLLVEFEHRYLLWGDVKLAGSTWGDLKAAGLKWGELKLLNSEALPYTPVTIIWYGPDMENAATGVVPCWWQTNYTTESTGWVDYGPTAAYGTRVNETPDPTPDDWHVAELTGLAPGTYHWRATATGPQGTTATMPDQTFVVP